MSAPYYQDDSVTLHLGDALATLRGLPDRSVDCCVTSPPYFGLRDYGVDGQIGAEASPAEFVAALVAVFAEVRRVLADDGTLWLNLGDSYAGSGYGNHSINGEKWKAEAGLDRRKDRQQRMKKALLAENIPPKNLVGIPWRVAFALQDDGWILRNDIIWAKPNGMPSSVMDRVNNTHEHVFLLTKARRYWFDLDPIRDAPRMTMDDVRDAAARTHGPNRLAAENGHTRAGRSRPIGEVMGSFDEIKGRNPGDVWTIATQPFPGAHFATMPPALAERCIVAGCKPGGVVLDPFSGSGTTGYAATKHGRRYVGIDLNREYLDLSLRTRLAQGVLLDGGAA